MLQLRFTLMHACDTIYSMEEDLKWFKVCCKDAAQKTYEVSVMAYDICSAEHCAEHCLLEEKNVVAKAVKSRED